VLSGRSDGLYVLPGFGMSRSLQIFWASMSLTSACLGTDERLFFVGWKYPKFCVGLFFVRLAPIFAKARPQPFPPEPRGYGGA